MENTGGEISLLNGAKVSLPAKGIIKQSDGSNYTGSVNVYAAYIDPAAADINETVPGSFMANDKNNKRVSLVSFGMMAVVLESASGEKLQIAKDKSAKLTIPISSSIQSSAPASISLWYVDEQTGLWKEEGSATKQGTNYVGDVKHFSFWNADSSIASINLSLTLLGPQGLPVVHGLVSIECNKYSYYGYTGYADSLGQMSGLVAANEPLYLRVIDQCGQTVDSMNIGPFSQNTNLGNITFGNTTASFVTIKGKLLDCNNHAIANGYAVIRFQSTVIYASTDANGDFSSSFVTCYLYATTCDVVGVDGSTQQQGAVVSIPLNFPVTDIGSLSTCGASASEFLRYNLDGKDIDLSPPGSDTSIAYSYSSPSTYTLYVDGYSALNNINFQVEGSTGNVGIGTFPLTYLRVNGLYTPALVTPFNVNVTNYAQNTGEFYEGNFSGQFRDSSNLVPLHKLTCSFRLRKF